MARHYQSEPLGLPEQLSSRSSNTGYRQAMNFCSNLSYQAEALPEALASLTLLVVRSRSQSTTPGFADPSNGFKLPGSSTRLEQCAAAGFRSDTPRGERLEASACSVETCSFLKHHYIRSRSKSAVYRAEFASLCAIHSLQGFPIQNSLPAYNQQRGSLPVYGKNTVKSTSKRQRSLGDKVKRTIYICDIDQQVQHQPKAWQKAFILPALSATPAHHCVYLQVTEEQLATVFQECGSVVDCRVCGDPNSAMKFAFIEFLEEAAVKMVSILQCTLSYICNMPLDIRESSLCICRP